MSDMIKQQLENKKKPLGILSGATPERIEVTPGEPAKIYLTGGISCASSCLHCPDQPCVKYSSEEGQNEILNKFRIDASVQTCGVDAIHWDYESSAPVIDNERCISCGVCAVRCPAQAIYLTSEGAKVSTIETLQSVFTPENDVNTLSHKDTRSLLNILPISGERLKESEFIASTIIKKIRELKGKVGGLVPNLLVRNILRSFGIAAVGYGQGVQYNTVDVLCFSQDIYAAVEVELTALIDTPRNLAAYVAVLVARHGIAKEDLMTFSVGLQLPNIREQYWMVVDDMSAVLDMHLYTITILGLLILLWSRKDFTLCEDGLYLSEKNGVSLRIFLEKKLGREIEIPVGWENQLEPAK